MTASLDRGDRFANVAAAQRWETETPYLADPIAEQLPITADSRVLDYGCGIGRLAHELIRRHGCRIVSPVNRT